VVIRFAGDSGDGIQLTGSQFTTTAALLGNDIASLPDFPAEIRAPRGTLAGVSGYQLHFASGDIFTPGDSLDCLVAFNPAALKANVADLEPNGVLIVNSDEFGDRDLQKAGYESSPLEGHSLDAYRLFPVAVTTLVRKALHESPLTAKEKDRCRNFFALGMAYWLYDRSPEATNEWIRLKFAKRPDVVEANQTALKAGYAYCEATEAFTERYHVAPAEVRPGTYRNVSGNSALALGLVAAARQAGKPLFYGSYPITPASDVLHELSAHRRFNVATFQAEDEIAAVASAIGASFAGHLAVTGTSGPGIALKSEAIGLAVMAELPLVVLDVQRGGPSTGLPTKTEQADLLQALFGRNGESPVAILAPQTPGDCFWVAYEACRLAMTYMTPVFVLSDGYLANGSEPWPVPEVADLPPIDVRHPAPITDGSEFRPYLRDPETLARPWALPGTAGLEHRLGGLEKADVTGHVSYDPDNHDHMIKVRQAKIEGMAREIPPIEVHGEASGEVLVVGWGSTWGALRSAVRQACAQGLSVGHVHLRHLNPLPADLGEVLGRFRRVLVPEINLGQLRMLLRARYLVDAVGLNLVRGKPYSRQQVLEAIEALHRGEAAEESRA
jgi:2-oxoglutarate ferredoxin oxidoreductase subunit alpha